MQRYAQIDPSRPLGSTGGKSTAQAPFFLLKDDELEAMSTGTLERARSLQKQRSNTISADISAEEARASVSSNLSSNF